jgi:hypothetical protein
MLGYTRIKNQKKITVLIRCANAGSVVEKTLASGLADTFSQHLPAWKPSATQCFQKDFWAKQGHLRSKMSEGLVRIPCELACEGIWRHSASLACPSAALRVSVFIRAHRSNPWFPK